MARPKKAPKAKEPVRIRYKRLSNGNQSIYLDIYQNGIRQYQFLKLYLIPETDQSSRVQNANTLQAANAIKAQKIIELTNGAANIKAPSRGKMKLSDWLDIWIASAGNGESNKTEGLYTCFKKHIIRYAGETFKMKDINPTFVRGFIEHLATKPGQYGRKLSPKTQHVYFTQLNTMLNAAVRGGVIAVNPVTMIDACEKPKNPESKREYLTVDEVKKLISTPCDYPIKGAFLFSCFCGLRWSDIKRLKWGNIFSDQGQMYARIVMKKTGKSLLLPLSAEAVKWMPERGTAPDEANVFDLAATETAHTWNLRHWVKNAGITKHVTFHVGRHTFATMMLTAGADLYTTSKLLGHTNVATTQIYAKIVDAKKVEAVNLVNNIFGNSDEDRKEAEE